MAKSITNVPAAVVRSWARENIDLIPADAQACLGATARGRLHPGVVAAFAKANRGKGYEATVAEGKSLTFKATVLNGSGRKTTREVTMSTSEVRNMLGHEAGRRGRFSLSQVRDAYEAAFAASVADTFAKAV